MDKEFDLPEMNADDELDEETEAEEDELIELVDEDGNADTFELLASFDLNGSHYLAVSSPIEEEDTESVEVFILKTEQDEDGNDIYTTPDEKETDAAFAHFMTLVDAEEE